MTIEGIPDGWELVRIGTPMLEEYYISMSGTICKCLIIPDGKAYAIIRKIEKPKQYQPFQNPTEAESLLGEVLRFKADHESKALFVGNMPRGVQVGLSLLTLKQAFETLERLDGTPFGIEVME